jgi:hypothetical protein
MTCNFLYWIMLNFITLLSINDIFFHWSYFPWVLLPLSLNLFCNFLYINFEISFCFKYKGWWSVKKYKIIMDSRMNVWHFYYRQQNTNVIFIAYISQLLPVCWQWQLHVHIFNKKSFGYWTFHKIYLKLQPTVWSQSSPMSTGPPAQDQ